MKKIILVCLMSLLFMGAAYAKTTVTYEFIGMYEQEGMMDDILFLDLMYVDGQGNIIRVFKKEFKAGVIHQLSFDFTQKVYYFKLINTIAEIPCNLDLKVLVNGKEIKHVYGGQILVSEGQIK